MCPPPLEPRGYGFCAVSVGTRLFFARFRLESSVAFEGTTGREKELYGNSKWISRSLFCLRSNLSNDDIISEYINL